MADWKDDKNLGPWPFTPQPNKWGYLNNPRWQVAGRPFVPGGPDDYDGREDEEPQIWTPESEGYSRGTTVKHHQCGHWHLPEGGGVEPPVIIDLSDYSFWQPSVDVYHGKISLCGQINGSPYGAACIQYIDNKWYALGGFLGMNFYLEPNTCRMTDEYVAFFVSGYFDGDPTFTNFIGVIRFSTNDYPRLVTAWTSLFGSPDYSDDYQIYNVMDCYGDRLACLSRVIRQGGVLLNKYQVKVSNDKGLSFDTTWTFPDVTSTIGAGGYFDQCQLRMSQDGIVWIAYKRSAGAAGTHMIELWKSNAAATSWTKVWETNFYADLSNHEAATMLFDINDEDGQYISIRLNWPGGGINTGYQVIYESRNGGASFNTHTSSYLSPAQAHPYPGKGTANAAYVVHGADVDPGVGTDQFYRSTDYGASFGLVDPGVVIQQDYTDQQKHHAEIAYLECQGSFAGSGDYLAVLYSDDNGATWTTIETPLPFVGAPDVSLEAYPSCTEQVVDNGGGNVVVTITPIVGPPIIRAFPEGLFATVDWADPRWVRFTYP